jgi:type IV pilus assembly protein PilB
MIKILRKRSPVGKKVAAQKEEEAVNVLSRLRHKSEEEEAAAWAAELNVPYVDTNLIPISDEVVATLPEEDSRKFNVALIHKLDKKVTLVATDPSNEETKSFVEKLQKENSWDINLFVVSKYNLNKIWEKYKKVIFVDILSQMSVSLTGEDLKKFDEYLKDLITLKDRIAELPVTQVLGVIMGGSYKLGASDVHIEPQKKDLRIRYRIDGVLHDVVILPLSVFKSIVSRIKMMAGMKLNLHDIAQDGAFEITVDNKKISVRVSIIPENYGESIVMRLLDASLTQVSVESLGLRGLAYEKVQKLITAPNGMLLTTGPTGSGKTTTLYAIVNKLNDPETKIITIEDPIEYEIKGLTQTQVENSRGYTFASGLRSIVRQDPDVILVGEIRDEETADIAVNSALTGHLVLSTIHTNSAVATVPRLIEMGIKPSLIGPSLNAIIGQRLVRKLCVCKEEYVPASEATDSIKKMLSIISPKAKLEIPKEITKLYRPKGCPKCNDIGYKGRTGIFEVFTLNEEIEKLVLNLAGESELTFAALESGMVTLLQDGLLKAVEGITSVEEVKRVTGEGDFLESIYEKLMSQTLGHGILISQEHFKKALEGSTDFQKFQKIVSSAKTLEINKIIFSAAVILGVGDIHLEPGANDVKIRFRIDGILQTVATYSLNEYPNLLGEIKLLSGVKTEVREGVVDSRFSIKFDPEIKGIKESSVDVRVSIILGGYGETAVLRILSKASQELSLEKLGMRKENLEKIYKEISKPNGIILTTGPTGSGKTTTLYSIINVLNKPEVKIITVEDPIEYQIEGILQTPVNEKDGYTFASALRSLLRQNPDILMVGEIRDDETAQIAVQSALTGHLVLSTLHTNNAAGSVQRLLNMGVSPSDVASAVNVFMAQRLVRKLCDHCKIKENLTAEEKDKIENTLKILSPKSGISIPKISSAYKTKGCTQCNHIGYKTRITISEVLVVDRDIQELISRAAITSEIHAKAVENGMITMEQDGVLKVLEGETTLEEIERVTNI